MTMPLYVLFRVGDASYVLPADAVVVMESFTGATKVPGTPDHVAGLVQIRGGVIPVIDLRRRFGLPPAELTLDSRVVVTRIGERTVGLLADSAREIVRLDPSAFRPPPEAVVEQSAKFVEAVAQLGDRLVLRIDERRVIGEEIEHGEERTL